MFQKLPIAAGLAFFTMLPYAVMAQTDQPREPVDVEQVVARVGDKAITLGQLIVARGALPEQYQQFPDEIIFEGLLEQIIQQEVLAQSLTGEPPASFAPALENETRILRASAALQNFIDDLDLEAEIQALYEERFANQEPETEYNASHILVETEEKALELVAMLEEGADFSELAQEHSTGPSGPSGGELGWFGSGQMVPEFEVAVMDLERETVSDPVQTQFGWHVIRLNDTRLKDAPTLEQVRDQLAAEAEGRAVDARVTELTEAASIERLTEDLDPGLISRMDAFE